MSPCEVEESNFDATAGPRVDHDRADQPWSAALSDQPKGAIQKDDPGPGGPIQADDQLLRNIMADVEHLVARHRWETTPQKRVAFLLRETIELAEEVLQLPDAGPCDVEYLRSRATDWSRPA